MGISYTPAQVNRIGAFPTRAILFDGEPAAQRRGTELCSALSALPGKTVNVVLESASQLDEADKTEVKELREKFLGEH